MLPSRSSRYLAKSRIPFGVTPSPAVVDQQRLGQLIPRVAGGSCAGRHRGRVRYFSATLAAISVPPIKSAPTAASAAPLEPAPVRRAAVAAAHAIVTIVTP